MSPLVAVGLLVVGALAPSLVQAEVTADGSGIKLYLIKTASGAFRLSGDAPTAGTAETAQVLAASATSVQCNSRTIVFGRQPMFEYRTTANPKAVVFLNIPSNAIATGGTVGSQPPKSTGLQDQFYVTLTMNIGSQLSKQVVTIFTTTGDKTVEAEWPDGRFTLPATMNAEQQLSIQVQGAWSVPTNPQGAQPPCLTVYTNSTAQASHIALTGSFDGAQPADLGGAGAPAANETTGNETGNATANETADDNATEPAEPPADGTGEGEETADEAAEPDLDVAATNNSTKKSGGIPGFGAPAFLVGFLGAMALVAAWRRRRDEAT